MSKAMEPGGEPEKKPRQQRRRQQQTDKKVADRASRENETIAKRGRKSKWPFAHPRNDHRPLMGWIWAQNDAFYVKHQKGTVYSVASKKKPIDKKARYTVTLGESPKRDHCTCLDFDDLGKPKPCYHCWLVRFRIGMYPDAKPPKAVEKIGRMYLNAKRIKHLKPEGFGAVSDATTVRNALGEEGQRCPELLAELCYLVERRERTGLPGHPGSELRDVAFGLVWRAFLGFSYERVTKILEEHARMDRVRKIHHRNTYWKYMGSEEFSETLLWMLVMTCRPVRNVETAAALDGTGFSGSVTEIHRARVEHDYVPVVDKESKWMRCVYAYGCSTGLVMAYTLMPDSGAGTGETTQFPEVVRQLKQVCNRLRYVIADPAYAHEKNFKLARESGFVLLSPPQVKWDPKTKKALGEELAREDKERLNDPLMQMLYDLRNLIEGNNNVLKRLFHSYLTSMIRSDEKRRKKSMIRLFNEMLCRMIAHNLRKLVHQEMLRDDRVDFKNDKAFHYIERLDKVLRLEREHEMMVGRGLAG